MTTHKARLFWFPAYQKWMVRCIMCGETLAEDPETVTFEVVGACKPPRSLGIHVEERIKTRDQVGGDGA